VRDYDISEMGKMLSAPDHTSRSFKDPVPVTGEATKGHSSDNKTVGLSPHYRASSSCDMEHQL
jgi:hypothetical protein